MEIAGIRERAVLVKPNISCWEGKKIDRGLSREVAREKGAKADDALAATKKLLWAKELDEIIKLRNKIRQYVDENTVAWMHRGPRLLASVRLLEFMKGWTELKDQYYRKAEELEQVYHQRREESMQMQGEELASLSDYPASLIGLFDCSLDIMPIPDVSDIRLDLDEENVKRVQEQMEERFKVMFSNSVADVWARIRDVLQALADKMRVYGQDDGVCRKMHDSILGNICQLVDLMPGLNVTQDPELDEMTDKMRKAFCSLAVENLCQDAMLRQDVADEAEGMLAVVKSKVVAG